MNKRFLKTVLSIFFSLLFIFGSMLLLNKMLMEKEDRLLSASGEMELESPVIAWNQEESQIRTETEENGTADEGIIAEDTDNEPKGTYAGNILTAEQMRDALIAWENNPVEVIHNPVEGQLTMEEAILIGKAWISSMSEASDLLKSSFAVFEANVSSTDETIINTNNEVAVTSISGTRATLSVKTSKEKEYVLVEPYYSCWNLQFYDDEVYVYMSLNAVTGQVWKAEIDLYADTGETGQNEVEAQMGSVYQFAELAGLGLSKVDSYPANDQGISLYFKDSPVYIEMKQGDTEVSMVEEYYDQAVENSGKEYISISYAVKTGE